MSRIRRIFKNMGWLFASTIIACICGFIWTILVARYLQVSEYGILGFATSLSGILGFTTDLGITTHIVRHISTDYSSANKYLSNAIPLKSLFAAGTFLLTLICLMVMKADEVTITVTLIITMEMILKSFTALFDSAFQAFEISKFQGIGNIILNITSFAFILISIFADLGIFAISASYLISSIIGLCYAYLMITRHVTRPKLEFDRDFCRKITIASLPFAVGSILYTIYFSIDIVMLSNLVGNYATGIYNACYKLISVLTVIQGIYGVVLFPVMNKLFKNEAELLTFTFEKSVKYLLMIIVPLALSIVIYSSDIINFIYGPEYAPAASTLSVLIWTLCLLFVTTICNLLLNASHKEVTVTKIYGIAAAFNIILNLVMIPRFSYIGAAITTVLSDVLIMVLQLYVVYGLGHRVNRRVFADIAKIIMATGVLGISLHILNLNMWVAIPVGIAIYLAAIILLRLFDDDDKHIIREIIGKN